MRTVEQAPPPVTTAVLRYFRPAGDYTGWGLHMWGDAVADSVLAQIAWDKPWPFTAVEDGWARYDIALKDDTKPVNFIMHLPSGDSVPTTREPGGDRSFVPSDDAAGLDQAGRPDGLPELSPRRGRRSARASPSGPRRWAVSPSTTTWAAADPSARPAM